MFVFFEAKYLMDIGHGPPRVHHIFTFPASKIIVNKNTDFVM